MFEHARAAGLPTLGGTDIVIERDGVPLRGHFWPAMTMAAQQAGNQAKTIIILPGFTEFCEKYAAEANRFHQKGFNVLIIDWPGQGRSGHMGSHVLAVHCLDFDHHLDALDKLISAAGITKEKVLLFGHSMGGHLALRHACRHPDWVFAVILSAPMMAPPVMPVWLVRTASCLLSLLGMARASPPFHQPQPLEKIRNYFPDNSLTRCQEGYDSQFIWFDDAPELRRSGPTIGWVCAAYRSSANYTLNAAWLRRLGFPVLAFLSGDERVVHSASSHSSLSLIPGAKIISFPGARHELTRELPEVTSKLWREVDVFLERLS